MTTTCDHHKERGLSCPFWDRCQSGFAHARHIARPLRERGEYERSSSFVSITTFLVWVLFQAGAEVLRTRSTAQGA